MKWVAHRPEKIAYYCSNSNQRVFEQTVAVLFVENDNNFFCSYTLANFVNLCFVVLKER